jgi:hypothetical protein
MERQTIALATKLLVKAQDTTFDGEAAALTAKAYRLLAEALNASDHTASPGMPRKRERRLLADRRSAPGSCLSSMPPRTATPAPAHTRRNWADLAVGGQVDLSI